MLPGITNSPPKRFTPRRLALLSRPLRLEPPPLLCAICQAPIRNDTTGSATGAAVDVQTGVGLAVPPSTAVAQAGAVLPDKDFLGAVVLDHRRCNGCPIHQWLTD